MAKAILYVFLTQIISNGLWMMFTGFGRKAILLMPAIITAVIMAVIVLCFFVGRWICSNWEDK